MTGRAHRVHPALWPWLAASLPFGGVGCGQVAAEAASRDSLVADANVETAAVREASADEASVDANGDDPNLEAAALEAGADVGPLNAAFDAEADTDDACTGACPYDIGNQTVDDTWFDFETAPDTVFLTTIVPPEAATIVSLRVIGRVAGGACDLYVYSDKNGEPDERVAYQLAVNVVAGPSGAPPAASATLTAGDTYWVGGNCSNSDGGTVELFQNNMLPAHGYVAVAQPYGALVPATFPLGTTRGNTYSFFLEVRAAL